MSQNFKKALQEKLKEVGVTVSMQDVAYILDSFKSVVTDFMLKNEEISIRGFFKILLQEIPPANRRNPKTGETILVGKKFYPKMSVADSFKSDINAQYQTK